MSERRWPVSSRLATAIVGAASPSSNFRLVTGLPTSPHGTITPKWLMSGATFSDRPCIDTHFRRRTPIAAIFAACAAPPALALFGAGIHTPVAPSSPSKRAT